MKKVFYTPDAEAFMLTVSSAATLDNFVETLTAETGGDCLGPINFELFPNHAEIVYLRDNWDRLEEMSKAEEDARIAHLAEEWGIDTEDLDYLR